MVQVEGVYGEWGWKRSVGITCLVWTLAYMYVPRLAFSGNFFLNRSVGRVPPASIDSKPSAKYVAHVRPTSLYYYTPIFYMFSSILSLPTGQSSTSLRCNTGRS